MRDDQAFKQRLPLPSFRHASYFGQSSQLGCFSLRIAHAISILKQKSFVYISSCLHNDVHGRCRCTAAPLQPSRLSGTDANSTTHARPDSVQQFIGRLRDALFRTCALIRLCRFNYCTNPKPWIYRVGLSACCATTSFCGVDAGVFH